LAKRFKDASLFLGRNANACVLNTEVKVYESPCKSEVLLRTQAVCRESLFFDRLKTELGNESLQACFTLITRVHFCRSNVLERLGRSEEAEAEQRACLRFMVKGENPEVLGFAMMTANNPANRLVDKKSNESIAEAALLRVRIHEVYPGPLRYGCVNANYRSWIAIGGGHYSNRRTTWHWRPATRFCKVRTIYSKISSVSSFFPP
jgi:hypothetical protein